MNVTGTVSFAKAEASKRAKSFGVILISYVVRVFESAAVGARPQPQSTATSNSNLEHKPNWVRGPFISIGPFLTVGVPLSVSFNPSERADGSQEFSAKILHQLP